MVKYFRLFRVPTEIRSRHLANTVANLEPGPVSVLTWRIVPKLLLGRQNAGFVSYAEVQSSNLGPQTLLKFFWGGFPTLFSKILVECLTLGRRNPQ